MQTNHQFTKPARLNIFLVVGIILLVSFIIGLGILIKKQSHPQPTPTPTPQTTSQKPTPPRIAEVAPSNACSLTINVKPAPKPNLQCISKQAYLDDPQNNSGNNSNNPLTSQDLLSPGQTFFYAINYKNTGNAATKGVITDTLPSTLTYKGSTADCSVSGQQVTCHIPSIGANKSGQIVLAVKVKPNTYGQSIVNKATLTPDEGQPSTCSNTLQIKPLPQLNCTAKQAYRDDPYNTPGNYTLNTPITANDTVEPGEIIVYALSYANTGQSTVNETTITDTLPDQVDYLDGQEGCTYNQTTNQVTCALTSIAPDQQGTIAFRVKVKADTYDQDITNSATLTPDEGQPSTCSNTITTSTTPTHLVCQNNACVEIEGEGQDECSTDSDCQPTTTQTPTPTPTSSNQPTTQEQPPQELPQAGIMTFTTNTISLGVIFLLTGLALLFFL